MLIKWIRDTKPESDLFFLPENARLKPVLSTQSPFQRLLCSQKADVKCSY